MHKPCGIDIIHGYDWLPQGDLVSAAKYRVKVRVIEKTEKHTYSGAKSLVSLARAIYSLLLTTLGSMQLNINWETI